MIEMSKISKEFSAALNLLLTKKFYGTAVQLAERVNTTDKYISQVKRGHRQASLDLQERIAEEMGLNHSDFVALGRMLIDGATRSEVEQKASVLRKRLNTHRVERSTSIGAQGLVAEDSAPTP
jgi:transcriptional regulator with XRE-family HTH domain